MSLLPNFGNPFLSVLVVIIVILIALGLSFLVISGLIWCILTLLGIDFKWTYTVVAYLVMILVRLLK